MLNELYSHFRQYWPERLSKGKKAVDGYVAEPAGESPEEEEEGEVDDMALAEALGVPCECVERLTPRKVSPEDVKEPSTDEKLDIQIRELQFLVFLKVFNSNIRKVAKVIVSSTPLELETRLSLSAIRLKIAKAREGGPPQKPPAEPAEPSGNPDQQQTLLCDLSPILRTHHGVHYHDEVKTTTTSVCVPKSDSQESLLNAKTRRLDSFAEPPVEEPPVEDGTSQGQDTAGLPGLGDERVEDDVEEEDPGEQVQPRNLASVFDQEVINVGKHNSELH